MDDLVKAFNKLPRPQTTPGGVLNHWYFCVRHVPLDPPGDVLHLVNPPSRFVHCEPPSQILSLPFPASQADIIVRLLLESFVSGMDKHSNRVRGFKLGPWSWGTKNRELAKAIESKLEAIGVRKELCIVQVGNKEEENVSNETWSEFQRILMEMMGRGSTICTRCNRDSSCFPNGLKLCDKCGWAWYCSPECEKADWNEHKKICVQSGQLSAANRPSVNPRGADLDAFTYYNEVAHTVPEAQALAESVNLTLPAGGRSLDGILKPIRRLIITGRDTPQNIALFLGPNWKGTAAKTYEENRLGILLDPPPGSHSYTFNYLNDRGAPFWSPRPATDSENKKIQKIREMQREIEEYLGTHKELTSDDMIAILYRECSGADRQDKMRVYQLAINTMDLGMQRPVL
ncbi:hypothetical protein VTN77DRAFT_1079 [Rasamsonia byssochlamydoides]|uniref:uncharacterized protein n=1 Tax=Rasamsonia byssochlamydoides TaxID=89139 RepID=UPI0037447020